MKKPVAVSFFLFLFLVVSCGAQEDEAVLKITTRQVEKVITVLPDVLSFSRDFYDSMSPEARETEEAYHAFFTEVVKSPRIQEKSRKAGFTDARQMISVYRQVVQAYLTIDQQMTNVSADLKELTDKLAEFDAELKNVESEQNLTREQKTQLQAMRRTYQENETRIHNIQVVYPFMDRLRELNRITVE